ncbi:MAG: DUF4394 domain-containing protein [Pusillimonas sp.]
MPKRMFNSRALRAFSAASVLATFTSSALATETLWVLTQNHTLLKVQASQPDTILDQKTLSGLPTGAALVGIDYRVAYGKLFALSDRGELFTIDTGSGSVAQVTEHQRLAKIADYSHTRHGYQYGFDFNPAADRIRVVNPRRENFRLHPETGAVAATDPNLTYAPTDPHAGHSPRIGAAAYTYNTKNDKLTTNFAIDLSLGNLVLQGSREDETTPVSPNNGVLFTVGSLGLGTLASASFDIADVSNRALAALEPAGSGRVWLYDIDLQTGKAHNLGKLAQGRPVRGIAIEP